MPLSVKVSGAWKTVSQVSVKVGGAWNTAIPYVKVGGAWKIAGVSKITVSPDWTFSFGASPLSSVTGTFTVPAGNPGVIRFNVILNDNTLQYSYNSGGMTTVTDEGTITVTNGSNLVFRFTGGSAEGCGVEVYDNTTGDLIGSWAGSLM